MYVCICTYIVCKHNIVVTIYTHTYVYALSLGRVRSSQKSSLETDNQSNVLSLNLFKPVYFAVDDGDRYV